MTRTRQLLATLLLMAGAVTQANATTLQALIDSKGTVIDDDKEFYDFIFVRNCVVPSGSIGFCVGDASGINVLPLTGPAVGLAFIGQLGVRSPGGVVSADYFIAYSVRVLDPTKAITGIGLSFNGAINGNRSTIDITEQAFASVAGATLGQAVVSNPPPTFADHITFNRPVQRAYITKDIAMNAGNTIASSDNEFFASLSLINQIYDQAEIPEPGSMALAGVALVGLALWRRVPRCL